MTRGSVSKIVSTFGSRWGRIRLEGTEREIFFNASHLADPDAFEGIVIGQAVEFEVHTDQVNGGHADQIVVVSDVPAGADVASPLAADPTPVSPSSAE